MRDQGAERLKKSMKSFVGSFYMEIVKSVGSKSAREVIFIGGCILESCGRQSLQPRSPKARSRRLGAEDPPHEIFFKFDEPFLRKTCYHQV